jgi:dienelactone hydrolase
MEYDFMNNTLMRRVRCEKRIGAALHFFTIVLVLALASVSLAMPHSQKPQAATKPSFDYKKSHPFDLKEESAKQEGSVVIRDVDYAAYTTERGRIKAYIVSPAGKGPFAGVLFFHWLGEPNGDRNEFLKEAVELAKRGTVSLLIQGYFPWAVQPIDAETDRQRVIDETIEVRRALDLLLMQQHVDRKRIGYVGHDYGAMYGAILSGIEKRVKTFVFVAGMGNFGDWSLKYWKGPSTRGAEKYRDVMRAVDPATYISRAAPATLFFQFSNADKYISRATADAFYDPASRPKEIRWYDTDHAMNNDAVRNERTAWLTRQLRLTK